MAKTGLAFYFVMSFGFTIIGSLFYLHFKYSPPLNEAPHETYMRHDNIDKLIPDSELRKIGERSENVDVPVADDKDGYM